MGAGRDAKPEEKDAGNEDDSADDGCAWESGVAAADVVVDVVVEAVDWRRWRREQPGRARRVESSSDELFGDDFVSPTNLRVGERTPDRKRKGKSK